jgi:hypothetical protein
MICKGKTLIFVVFLWTLTSCQAQSWMSTSPNSLQQSNSQLSQMPIESHSPSSNQTNQTNQTSMIREVQKTAFSSGDSINIYGDEFLKSSNYTVELHIPGNERKATSFAHFVNDKMLNFVVPYLPSDLSANNVSLFIFQDGNRLSEVPVHILAFQKSDLQEKLIQTINKIKEEDSSQPHQLSQTTEIIGDFFKAETNNEVAIKQLDYALSSTINSLEDIDLVINILDEYTGKNGFQTKATLIDQNHDLVLKNPIQRSPLDPDKYDSRNAESKLLNRLPECDTATLGDLIPENDNRPVVIYVNGVNTRSDQFCNTKQNIEKMFKSENIPAIVTGMYQHSIREDQESPDQVNKDEAICQNKKAQYQQKLMKLDEKNLVQTSNKAREEIIKIDSECHKSTNAFFFDAFKEIVDARTLGWTHAQVDELANIISRILQKNKRIILMPHSQGNFFVRQALERLLGEAKNPNNIFTKDKILNSVGVVWMASPVEAEHAKYDQAKICSDLIKEPTCHSVHVGVRQDVIAHLRYLNDFGPGVANPFGSPIGNNHSISFNTPSFVTVLSGKTDQNEPLDISINPDYLNEYQDSVVEAPIDIGPATPVDAGVAGETKLNISAHDVDCVYLYDRQNPSDYCVHKGIKPLIFQVDPTPRAKVLSAIKTFVRDLQYPIKALIPATGLPPTSQPVTSTPSSTTPATSVPETSLPDTNIPRFASVTLAAHVNKPDKIYFSGQALDDRSLASITLRISGPKVMNKDVFIKPIQGTSLDLSQYYFDSNNPDYAGLAGDYGIALIVTDTAGNSSNVFFQVQVTDETAINNPDTIKPYFSNAYLSSSVTKPNAINFSGNAYDDKGLSIITMKVSGPKGNDLTAFSNNISGTSHSLSGYYFDSNNSYYAGVAGSYTVALWIKDSAGNTESKVFGVQVR